MASGAARLWETGVESPRLFAFFASFASFLQPSSSSEMAPPGAMQAGAAGGRVWLDKHLRIELQQLPRFLS